MDSERLRIKERHIMVEILAVAAGMFLHSAVANKNLVDGTIAIGLGLMAYIIDCISIHKEEEQLK